MRQFISANKQRLMAFARVTGFLPLLEAVYFTQRRRLYIQDNQQFLRETPHFSPPPLWWMHDMYSHTSYRRYWTMGRDTAAVIAAKISLHTGLAAPRVADWGCGLGRVVRHLPKEFRASGFDYNRSAVAWCAETIKDVTFQRNALNPPLPAPDASFDALYALSVFTHLSAQGHEAWMREIERVLAPRGVFLGAFHMIPRPGQLLAGEQKDFDEGRLVIRGSVKEGSRIFTAYHPEPYLRDVLLRNFEILEPPSLLSGQTLFIARKK